jgi:predicted nucleic acid-binding protein
MSEDIAHPVFLDATVLSNFASSGTVARLVTILDRPVAVPAVREELAEGHEQSYGFLSNALDHLGEDIVLIEIADREGSTETDLRDHLDEGEAKSLLGAIEHDGTLATDDLAARRIASDFDVPVTGSVGVLVSGIRRGAIDIDTANEWLTEWREKRGYYAPVERVEDILE